MFNLPTPGHHNTSTVDLLVQLGTLALGLIIAAALKFAIDAWRRRRARKLPSDPPTP
jgi:hypothetical protein